MLLAGRNKRMLLTLFLAVYNGKAKSRCALSRKMHLLFSGTLSRNKFTDAVPNKSNIF